MVKRPRKVARWANICLFLACIPVIIFLGVNWRPKEKTLHVFNECTLCQINSASTDNIGKDLYAFTSLDLNEHDAILSVDLLNNWSGQSE